MRFGTSATFLIVPEKFLSRFRPVNVCAIFSLSIRLHRAARAPLRTAAIHRDHQDRRRGRPVLCDSGLTRTAAHFFFHRDQSRRFTIALEFGVKAVLLISCPRPPGCLTPGISLHLRPGRDKPGHDVLIRSIPGSRFARPGSSPRHARACPGHPRLEVFSIPGSRSASPRLSGDGIEIVTDYFNSTFAPTFSSVALILLASSLPTPSLTVFGAPSTRSLASFKPRPVSARTSLITSIFLSPALASTTVNSVFSSTAAAPPAAGPAATATAAAAETPHFSSSILARSAASRTVRPDNSSTIFFRSAIFQFLSVRTRE